MDLGQEEVRAVPEGLSAQVQLGAGARSPELSPSTLARCSCHL